MRREGSPAATAPATASTPPAAEPVKAASNVPAADQPVADKIKDTLGAKSQRYFDRKGERAAVEKFYGTRDYAPLWTQSGGLTDNARQALDAFRVALRESADDVLEFDLEPSRLLVFDNYRVLHKRRSFDMGADWAAARWLRRCYGCMSLMNGVFADRVHQPYVWK